MPQITYVGINQKVECPYEEASILETSLHARIPHLHECGGNGRCTTCRVRILHGHEHLSQRTQMEKEIAQMRRWDDSVRLACQTIPMGDVSVQRLLWANSEISALQLETIPEGEAEERPIAILFCDIRGFTEMSSKRLAFDTAHMLNRFYTAVGDPILMNNGIIYQYVGDEIVAVFGTSGGMRDKNCLDAVRAAMGMVYAVERLNRFELEGFDVKLKIGIGLHYGRAFIGHLGHPKHRQFSVIGDPVNVTSRIQSATKEYGATVLASKAMLVAIPDDTLNLGDTISLAVSGKDDNMQVFPVLGFQNPDMTLLLQSSLDILLQDEEEFAADFYKRLFEREPAARHLFKNDMKSQGRLLMHMLGGVVHSLSRPEHLVLGLRMLGRRHSGYGVTDAHYPIVCEVMLDTISAHLGDYATEETITAWSNALEFVTEKMRNWEQRPA